MAFLIVHPQLGIYIGKFLRLSFWSKYDHGGQSSAITFLTLETAKKHVSTIQLIEIHKGIYFVEVKPDRGIRYASIDACAKAGLSVWTV